MHTQGQVCVYTWTMNNGLHCTCNKDSDVKVIDANWTHKTFYGVRSQVVVGIGSASRPHFSKKRHPHTQSLPRRQLRNLLWCVLALPYRVQKGFTIISRTVIFSECHIASFRTM